MTNHPAQPPGNAATALPLFLAGAALVVTGWLAYDRFVGPALHDPTARPRDVSPRGELADFERTTMAVFESNAPSVVNITSPAVVDPSTWTSYPAGGGTGFVWDARGYIVTNFHVVVGRSLVEVRMHGTKNYSAVVVGSEPKVDVAVLKLTNPPGNLRPLELGTSKDLRVGQAVFAIGNPFGLDHTLTTGVVSALDRVIESVERTPIEGVIQVDAAINPGNSGGPLLDSAGRLIGMNTAIYSPSGASAGIGFAVPVDTINRVVPRLIAGDRGQRPALGITLDNGGRVRLTDGSLHPVIESVVEGSGAAAAGLRGGGAYGGGDVILGIDGHPVNRYEDLQAVLENRSLGDTVQLEVLRTVDGRDRIVKVPVELRTEIQKR